MSRWEAGLCALLQYERYGSLQVRPAAFDQSPHAQSPKLPAVFFPTHSTPCFQASTGEEKQFSLYRSELLTETPVIKYMNKRKTNLSISTSCVHRRYPGKNK